ncbi:hypothetical protein AAH678_02045 [Sodalis endosymbiont of Spalangia cameroni]|uniref:hypothetical protein n=1 Tax=Sodalis praecaptivus TaxID=1239307 RepID=UPI0031F92085
MSESPFSLRNVAVAIALYSEITPDEALYNSPQVWCAQHAKTLTEEQIDAALEIYEYFDLACDLPEILECFSRQDSDLWLASNHTHSRYSLWKDDSLDWHAIAWATAATALFGYIRLKESEQYRSLAERAALTLAFAAVQRAHSTLEIINNFEDLSVPDRELQAKREERKAQQARAASAKHEKYFAPLQEQFRIWAQHVIEVEKGAEMSKAAFSEKVYAHYLIFLGENPEGTKEYNILHPIVETTGKRIQGC